MTASNTAAEKTVYVIVPVLNEEANIPRLIGDWHSLLTQLPEYNFRFILVDDGSTDNTVVVSKQAGSDLHLTVLSHTTNKGPGYAFGTGFEHLSSVLKSDDIVITMEGDNTSRIGIIGIMINRIIREDVDVVLASPYAYGGGIQQTTLLRSVLSYGGNTLVKIVLGVHGIHTFSSFFRAYKGSIIQELQRIFGIRVIEKPGFECMIELLKKLIMMRVSISEIPMNLDTSLRAGKSKMRIVRTVRGYLGLIRVSKHWEEQYSQATTVRDKISSAS